MHLCDDDGLIYSLDASILVCKNVRNVADTYDTRTRDECVSNEERMCGIKFGEIGTDKTADVGMCVTRKRINKKSTSRLECAFLMNVCVINIRSLE